jgi:hypothetical protein
VGSEPRRLILRRLHSGPHLVASQIVSLTFGSMPEPSAPAREARRILGLIESDRKAALTALERIGPEAQVALICESPLAVRAKLLALVSQPEEVIPLLPPAELCFVVKSVAKTDAGGFSVNPPADQKTDPNYTNG